MTLVLPNGLRYQPLGPRALTGTPPPFTWTQTITYPLVHQRKQRTHARATLGRQEQPEQGASVSPWRICPPSPVTAQLPTKTTVRPLTCHCSPANLHSMAIYSTCQALTVSSKMSLPLNDNERLMPGLEKPLQDSTCLPAWPTQGLRNLLQLKRAHGRKMKG